MEEFTDPKVRPVNRDGASLYENKKITIEPIHDDVEPEASPETPATTPTAFTPVFGNIEVDRETTNNDSHESSAASQKADMERKVQRLLAEHKTTTPKKKYLKTISTILGFVITIAILIFALTYR